MEMSVCLARPWGLARGCLSEIKGEIVSIPHGIFMVCVSGCGQKAEVAGGEEI